MSVNSNLQPGAVTFRDGYEIKSFGGCRLVFGPIPLHDMGMLTHGFSKKAVMAGDIADRIGAAFVIGEPGDIDALRQMDLPVSEKRHADSVAATQAGLNKVAAWLRTGERGASSNAMCRHLFGVPADAGKSHPLDPSDLRRCILFLDAADAHEKVPMMASLSPQWAALVSQWDALIATFREEIVAGKFAPKTYELMRAAAGE